ncbi:MAG: response regulator [Pseudomonadota bacterium]
MANAPDAAPSPEVSLGGPAPRQTGRRPRWLGFRSLQAKFLAFVIPLVLISTVVVFAFFEANTRSAAETELRTKLNKMITIQSAVVAESLWNVADGQISLILAALMTDPDVLAAVVTDERGGTVAEVGDVAAMAGSHLTATQPIYYGTGTDQEDIGSLSVTLTDAKLKVQARGRMWLALVLASILLLAVTSATLIANRQTIGRPLGLLLASINRAHDTGQRVAVDWHSNDEIGVVVAAFNEMQERQDRSESELMAARDELEARVDERTQELAQATDQARRAQSQLADAIESISDGFALYDRNDRLVVANTRYNDIVAGTGGERLMPGALFSDIARRAVDSGQIPVAAEMPDALVERHILHHRMADAPYLQELAGGYWIRVSNRRTEEGGTVAVHTDITELKRVSDELRSAKETAEAANEAKSAFLATMSHEIRTPLNGIIGMSTLLNATELDAEQRDCATTIVQAAETLLAIINDILDFSKVEAGALELEKAEVNLTDVFETTAELVAPKVAEKGLELACRIGHDVPAGIIGDQVRLKQILLNLLNNAAKFTEHGEIVLGAETVPGHRADGAVLLKVSVTDTGIGIPEDRMDRLFKSFSQVDASTTRRYGGTGLGLVITKRLVELMGGEIVVDSKVGKGTTFSFTLPVVPCGLPDAGQEERRRGLLKGRQALVVDDNRTNRHILEERLHSWGMTCRTFGGPVEALEWVSEGGEYDIAIIDYKMPKMTGTELAQAIKTARQASQTPPMILFTSIALLDADFRQEIEAIGFEAVLSKPAKAGQLLSAMAGALSEKSAAVLNADQAVPTLGPDKDPGAQEDGIAILLVDDNTINRKVGRKILKRLGYEPDIVDGGYEAVAACKNRDYDIVLMDIEMPDMDGIAATQKITEELGPEARPFIVALTANAMAAERERYLKSGMDGYLSKPIDIDALSDLLDSVVAKRGTTPAEARS